MDEKRNTIEFLAVLLATTVLIFLLLHMWGVVDVTQTMGLPGGNQAADVNDQHGCLTSSGYLWNETAEKCMKPLNGEVQEVPGLQNQSNATALGGDRDEHGCIASAGYTWCGTKRMCLRLWEENCPPEKRYVANSTEECQTIRFACDEGEAFFDDNGCGCETGASRHYCTEGEKKSDKMCPQAYQPVCGSNNNTYDNECNACKDQAVVYWVNGECQVSSTTETQSQTQSTTTTMMLIGGERDEHGCLIPAGYAWNETAGNCMRPWSGEVQEAPIACTQEAKVCPNGRTVSRDPENNCEFVPCPTPVTLTAEEAASIAAASDCTAEGTLTNNTYYNENTKTWWIDLEANKTGCSPACVIDEESKTAEINWRCTGLIPPE
ncbi:MAG: Kazal-type serine protease inhibitor family protein [Candidatus Altiarchaeota archaeon]|nr:Kazal-type serine protease inhibitor family protein [Candidatus Altiarchaeota archaeon]